MSEERGISPNLNINVVVGLIGVLSITMVGAIVALSLSGANTSISIVVGSIAPTVAVLLTLLKVQETHKTFNSKMDKLLKVSELAAEARGKLEGRSEAKAEQAAQAGPPSLLLAATLLMFMSSLDIWLLATLR